MLRGLFDKFLQRDLAAERNRIHNEGAELDERTAEINKRFEALKSRRDIAERRVSSVLSKLDRWVAKGSEDLPSAKAEEERLEAESDEIKQLYREIDDEITALGVESTELAQEYPKLTKRRDATNETEKRRIRNIYRSTFVAELITAATTPITFAGLAEHSAHVVHLDYYSAVAAITPVLFVAGLVEVALLGLFPGRWLVACFSLPAVAATVGALIALGTHHSTPATFSLTVWGLAATTFTLILYFVIHSESSSSKAAM